MREHSSYLINVNFLPFKSSIILEGNSSELQDGSWGAVLADVSYMSSAQITGPFLTWCLQIPININFESPIFSIQSLKNESPLKRVL